MATRPLVWDMFCGAGGAAKGYHDAGFDVIGFDLDSRQLAQYPYQHYQMDALTALGVAPDMERVPDLIHASPPCQGYSQTALLNLEASSVYPKLIHVVRELASYVGIPYVIENVEDARPFMVDPVTLCGQWFHDNGYPFIRTYRHRLFETSFPLTQPPHEEHRYKNTKMGRRPAPGTWLHVVGHVTGVDECRAAMGIDWMNRDALAEAIPPCYTEYIGAQFLTQQQVPRAA